MKRKRVHKRGATRMKEQGMKLVSLWFDQTEASAVTRAAEAAGQKVATWVREVAVKEAKFALLKLG